MRPVRPIYIGSPARSRLAVYKQVLYLFAVGRLAIFGLSVLTPHITP